MDSDVSNGCNNFGPDYFSFYKCEIAELLSQHEDFLPSRQISVSAEKLNGNRTSHCTTENNCTSSSLFSNCIGPEVSETKREQLKSLLCQGVFALSPEVDEMVDPVFNMCQLQSCLRFKESLLCSSAVASDIDQEHPSKKPKHSTLSSPASEGQEANDVVTRCTQCHTETPQWRSTPEETKPLCSVCRHECNEGKEPLPMNKKNEDSVLGINAAADTEDQEVDDLQFLLQNDSSVVDEEVKKHSDDLAGMLGHMEQKLEELLDIVMSKCRLMTLAEKQELQRMIKNLPPRNLDTVVEIIQQRHGQSNENSCNKIHIDLEKEDNITLWRLYFYIEAFENAKKLRDA